MSKFKTYSNRVFYRSLWPLYCQNVSAYWGLAKWNQFFDYFTAK